MFVNRYLRYKVFKMKRLISSAYFAPTVNSIYSSYRHRINQNITNRGGAEMVLQKLWVSQSFRRISRVLVFYGFLAVMSVSQFRFFLNRKSHYVSGQKRKPLYRLLAKSPIYLSPFLKTTSNSRKLRLNRTKLFYLPLDFLALSRHPVFAPRSLEKTHAISSRRCMSIRGKLELRLEFPIILIVIEQQKWRQLWRMQTLPFSNRKKSEMFSPKNRMRRQQIRSMKEKCLISFTQQLLQFSI